jgi:PelA/Pel-15E family pectate lyase
MAAQYPNGGWPQYFPLRRGYYRHITYNDGAMIGVMTFLRGIVASEPPFDFVDQERRAKAKAAIARGLDCILKTQVKQNGKLTAWCAQHDEKTFAPAWARAYEPPSLSGAESVGIVRFLMSVENPTPEIIATVEGAVEWLKSVAIHGMRFEQFTDTQGRKDSRIVADPEGGLLWARFYELGSNRPIFLDRDSVIRHSLAEVGQERRAGYAWYGNWADKLLAREYPQWRSRHNLATRD